MIVLSTGSPPSGIGDLKTILAILFRPFGLLARKTSKIIWLSNLSILSVSDEGYSRNALCALNLISTFYYYHWVDTSAGGLLVLEGIISPVVSASALTWFNRFTYDCGVYFIFNMSIAKYTEYRSE